VASKGNNPSAGVRAWRIGFGRVRLVFLPEYIFNKRDIEPGEENGISGEFIPPKRPPSDDSTIWLR
jgi:hypothetical protein